MRDGWPEVYDRGVSQPPSLMIVAHLHSVAHHAPSEVLTNRDLEASLDTSDAWIQSRTGIESRHVLRGGGVSSLVIPAARAALKGAGISGAEIDCVIVATVTPDHAFPSTASLVINQLGFPRAWGFDLSAACSGFTFGLTTAVALVESGRSSTVLLCAADRMTAVTDYSDRSSAVLFGDCGTAAVVQATASTSGGRVRVLNRVIESPIDRIWVPAGGSAEPATAETVRERRHFFRQDGRSVFRAAVTEMVRIAEDLVAASGLSMNGVRWLVPHQANRRIIEAVGERLGFGPDRVLCNVERFGNTGAATIPSCLSQALADGRLNEGDSVLAVSFGAGYSVGACLWEWQGDHRSLPRA